MSPVARATSYTLVSDEDLIQRSPIVVVAEVLETNAVDYGSGLVNTECRVEVLEYLRGGGPRELTVVVPGGDLGDRGWWVAGAPRLQVGEQTILFLGYWRDGKLALSELGLSKFDVLEDPSGNQFAARAMFLGGENAVFAAGANGAAKVAEPLRPLGDFLERIRNASSTEVKQPAFVDHAKVSPAGPLRAIPGNPDPAWVEMEGTGSGGVVHPIRWPWNLGAATPTVRYQPSTGQANLSDGSNGVARMTNAVGVWPAVSGTDIRVPAPVLGTGGGIQITLNDLTAGSPPFSSPCWTGGALCGAGVLGCGGPGWSGSHTFDGRTYYSASQGYLFMRQYSCSTNADLFETALAHEFGHILGLGHSDQAISVKDPDQVQYSTNHCAATMRSCLGVCSGGCGSVNNLRVPLSLGADDQTAVRYTYPSAVTAPTLTSVSPNNGSTSGGTSVTITGTNFAATPTVSFGGTAATGVTFVSSTTVRATTSAHAAGPVNVVVTNPDAQSATLASGYAYLPPPSASRYYVITPCRLFDTRDTTGAAAAAPILAANETRTFDVSARCGVPDAAVSLTVNATVTGSGAVGEIRIFPGNGVSPNPPASTLSYAAGKTRANNSIVRLSTDGTATLKVQNVSAAAVHFILDVSGYYRVP